jgi:UDP-glucose 4-epimerase
VNVVFHIAALVGPFHEPKMYETVNYTATLHINDACRKYKAPKLVFSSSPSTRFTGADICGLTEDDLSIPNKFLALYAQTKAIYIYIIYCKERKGCAMGYSAAAFGNSASFGEYGVQQYQSSFRSHGKRGLGSNGYYSTWRYTV